MAVPECRALLNDGTVSIEHDRCPSVRAASASRSTLRIAAYTYIAGKVLDRGCRLALNLAASSGDAACGLGVDAQ